MLIFDYFSLFQGLREGAESLQESDEDEDDMIALIRERLRQGHRTLGYPDAPPPPLPPRPPRLPESVRVAVRARVAIPPPGEDQGLLSR